MWTRVSLASLLWLVAPLSALAQDGEEPIESEAPAETAPAEQDPTERARALFTRGMACVAQHETACAVEAFRAALALRDTPAIRYNLASTLFELRRYPEAARLAASVLRDDATPADVRAAAEVLQGQLEAQGGTLAITIDGDATDTVVSVDGEPIPQAQREAVIVAPGPRVVTASRGETELARSELRAVAGERAEVTLAIEPEVETIPPVALEPSAPTPLHEDPIFWSVAAGGVAVVIAIIVIVAVATSGTEAPIEGNYEPGILRWD